MPDLGHEAYLWVHLANAGLCIGGSNVPIAITAVELDKWAERTGVELSPWEFSTILMLSRTYCSHLIRSQNPDYPPPYGNLVNDFDRASLAKKMRVDLKAFIAASKKR